jgi:flagellar motility protein MotE (MotC chaperone)
MLEKINKPGSEQLGTYRGRKEAFEIKRTRQKEVDEWNVELTLAQTNLQKVEHDLADIDEQLRQIRGY